MAERSRFHIQQAGVVAWRTRVKDGEVEFLLVTSSNGQRWVIPKGHVEAELSPADSAVAEAYEEAGLKGQIESRSLGSYEYKKWGNLYHVEVFLFEIDEALVEWPEAHVRRRKWVSPSKATEMVAEPELQELFARAERRLARLVH